MLAWTLVTFLFHLPSVDGLDSCRVGQAPNTDLESCYVMVQERWKAPRVLYRTWQRGQQGELKQFTVSDTLEAEYWVETADASGNRIRLGGACGPNVVQVARTTGVTTGEPTASLAGERWYDVTGRRLAREPREPGVYWSSRRGLKVVLR